MKRDGFVQPIRLTVTDEEGADHAVDTGFIVFNQKTYPNFVKLLKALDVAWKPSDMSFSVKCELTGLEYNGTSINTLFAQRTNALRPSFLGMIRDILAFYDVTITNPRVLGGIFIGVLLAFLFSAMTMNAVGRAAYQMMNECRRQFGVMRAAFRKNGMSEEDLADPESWPKQVDADGKQYPDYANCVAISTASAGNDAIRRARSWTNGSISSAASARFR